MNKKKNFFFVKVSGNLTAKYSEKMHLCSLCVAEFAARRLSTQLISETRKETNFFYVCFVSRHSRVLCRTWAPCMPTAVRVCVRTSLFVCACAHSPVYAGCSVEAILEGAV